MGARFTVFRSIKHTKNQFIAQPISIKIPQWRGEEREMVDNKNITERSILLVDNEKLIRNSFGRELREEGFAVTTIANGSEAIDELEKKRYDLVITDLMMPGVDGFGVLKAVKKRFPQTAVIVLASYGDMQSVTDALHLGADDFTLKPCDVDELVFRIRRCLERQRLLQMLAIQGQP